MRHSTRNLQHTVLEGKHKRRSRERRPAVEGLEERALLSAAHGLAVHKNFAVPDAKPVTGYHITYLVSGVPIKSGQLRPQLIDPSLVDPWEINWPQDTHNDLPVWVADQGAGVATMYSISSDGSTVVKSPLTVTIPTVASSTPTGPTGVVSNSTQEFEIPGPDGYVPAQYIFDTLQGTIEGWNPGSFGGNSSAVIMVNNSSTLAQYTGLAAGNVGGSHYIYAVNDNPQNGSPGIEVYNGSFDRVTLSGGNFVDPKLPKGFKPFGVHDLGNELYVTYRSPKNVGGAVAEFNNDGTFFKQIASDTNQSGHLQSPWGMDQAPSGFGKFGNDLLVGNVITGQIDAYNASGVYQGPLPIKIPGLRSIHFGAGLGASGPKIALLFTAGSDNGKVGLSGTGTVMPVGLYGTITYVTKTK